MRYNPFRLFQAQAKELVADPDDAEVLYRVVEYTYLREGSSDETNQPLCRLRVRLDNMPTKKDLVIARDSKVDNTGNFYWPAEEVLGHWLLQNLSSQSMATVVEVGAGVGLAGFALSVRHPHTKVYVTDGNPGVVQNIMYNAKQVASSTGASCEAVLMPWHVRESFSPLLRSDVTHLVGADCLFFDDYHEALCSLVNAFLEASPRLTCWFIAPRRGKTLESFVERVRSTITSVQVTVAEDYDPWMTKCHKELLEQQDATYEPDKHFPLLVTITKSL